MDKQEAIEKLKSKAKSHWLDEAVYGDNSVKAIELNMAIDIVNQIDEPEKPVVPQFVADWYEEHKDDFEFSLYALFIDFRRKKLNKKLYKWYGNLENKPTETLVMMHKFGYEVEKEKLYTVELPNQNAGGHVVLCKTSDGIVSIAFTGMARWQGCKNFQLTEAEIKKDFDWAWKFRKEVEE